MTFDREMCKPMVAGEFSQMYRGGTWQAAGPHRPPANGANTLTATWRSTPVPHGYCGRSSSTITTRMVLRRAPAPSAIFRSRTCLLHRRRH